MTYTALYLHDKSDGGISQPVLADTDAAAIFLANLNTPENHHLSKLEREDGRSIWEVHLERRTSAELAASARYYDMEAQRLGDRYFYEMALGRKSSLKLKREADLYKRMSESIRRHLVNRETRGHRGEADRGRDE